MTEVASFRSSSLKMNRALDHIRELEDLIESWRRLDSYRVSIGKEEHTRQNVLRFIVTKSLPEDVALIIGDAIHNLRTALDHAAYELLCLSRASKKDLDQTYFPFEGDRARLEASRKFKTIQTNNPKIAATILDIIRPYKGGNDTLWNLNKVDNHDKHRLLVPHFQAISVTIDALRGSEQITLQKKFQPRARIHGSTICLPADLEIKGHREPIFDIFFGEGFPLSGQSVVEALIRMNIEVSKALKHLKDSASQ
jgi:hypothetical protein